MSNRGYYQGLSAERLRHCYDLASPRVKRYLEAEIRFVLEHVAQSDVVLELGCGYGRVAKRLTEGANRVVGIDTTHDSVALARRLAASDPRCEFLRMDATELAFADSAFDQVVCVQNGICAFAVAQERLLREAVRVARPGGRVLFSTYSDHFWPYRLAWFRAQAVAGLLGEIDEERTGDGTIVCKDGFQAGRALPEELSCLAERLGVEFEVVEIDASSVFLKVVAP